MPDYLDDDGTATVLLGVTDSGLVSRLDGPLSPIRLVGIKLLTRAETQYCVRHHRYRRRAGRSGPAPRRPG
ncbi:hypothetical protein ACWDYH_24705 [Nocardia goodfellowii]